MLIDLFEKILDFLLEGHYMPLIIGAIVFGIVAYLLLEVKLRKISGQMKYSSVRNKANKKYLDEEKPGVPALNTDEAVYIGKDKSSNAVYIPNHSHTFVCGTTGTGKTVTLSNFIKSAIDKDLPLLIVDGKGDIGTGSLIDIVDTLKGDKKLYVIDLNNPLTSDKYNPFKNTSATIIKDMLINMSEWSEEHYKLNTERYIQKVIDLIIKSGIKPCLQDIIEHISILKFTTLSKELLENGVITKDEHALNLEIAKTSGKISEDATARFSTLIEGELGSIFDYNGIDVLTALQERAIILFILNPLSYPELSPRIGNLIVIDSKKAMSELFKNKLGRILFIFDEINVYASTSFLDLVNKSRSAEITCVLASQTLSDIDSVSIHLTNQVVENCNNYIVMRQNTAENSERWANIIGTKETMDFTYNLHDEVNGSSLGSAKKVREYIYHPDFIKSLVRGRAIYISKDTGEKKVIDVYKPF